MEKVPMLLMRLIGGAIGFFLGELAVVVPFALLEYPLTSLWEWESGHGIAALPVPNMVILAGGSIGAAARIRFLQERTAMGAGISAGREHPRSRPPATVKPLWRGLVAPEC
jgi:hypothetical protein